MSRIGKKPISVPAGVEVEVKDGTVSVKGKNGGLSFTFHEVMTVDYDDGQRELHVKRPNDQRQSRELHGLTRSIINNMVLGVTTYFEKRLEIVGVGYQASLKGDTLEMQVGFANTIRMKVPAGVVCQVPDNTHIVLQSADKQAVGQFAAEVRGVRPPEPYKGKGIRYQGEHVRRKAGKALASK